MSILYRFAKKRKAGLEWL